MHPLRVRADGGPEIGSIIKIYSFAGKYAGARRVGYASSKSALVGLTRGLELELGAYGIRINTITPGPVEGERVDEVIERMSKAFDKSKDEIRIQILDMSPLHAMATADDISGMTLMLASDDGPSMTGQDINITAGIIKY
ncbi:MAG: SDR family oxidoreductase [Proteobacteria bacterium]|nr:SDR family oxidoreductase [Pseudomonadota bacterium]